MIKEFAGKYFCLAFVVALVVALTSPLLVGPAVADPAGVPPAKPMLGFDPGKPLAPGFVAPTFEFLSAEDVLALPEPPDPKTSLAEYRIYQTYMRRLGKPKLYTPGSAAHFYSRWNAYQSGGGKDSFQQYRASYVRITDNRNRGWEFEKLVRKSEEALFSRGDWRFGRTVAGTGGRAKPDAYSDVDPNVYEYKSSANLRLEQLPGLVAIATVKNKTLVYLFQEPPSKNALAQIDQANRALPENAGVAPGQPLNREVVVARYYPAVPVGVPVKEDANAPPRPDNWNPPPGGGGGPGPGGGPVTGPGGGAGVLAAPGQRAVDGGLSDELAGSADSAADAVGNAELDQAVAAEDAAEFGPRFDADETVADGSGGVDFSTLELRYVADTHRGEAAEFAFSADSVAGDGASAGAGYGGREAARLASDAFFVWLELPTSSFTVNLNPGEPERVIDGEFGRTDAGRVLLEADLRMKKTTAQLIDPDTPLGRQFWDGLRGGANKCLAARSWIVPGTATVHDTGHELYILDAPLTVKTESQYLADTGSGQTGSCGQDADAEYNEQLFRTMVLPVVQQRVNEAPEYADLRRVYFSRIAAQWYRDRSAHAHTVYSDLIDKGDISRWQTTENWTPTDTYNRYVISYRDGEFHRTYTTTQGDMVTTQTYLFGGVDFTSVAENGMSGASFTDQHRTLPRTVGNALYGPTADDGNTKVWLGGMTADRPIDQLAPTVPLPATSKPSFYVLAGLPIALWLMAGVWILRRRRRSIPTASGTTP